MQAEFNVGDRVRWTYGETVGWSHPDANAEGFVKEIDTRLKKITVQWDDGPGTYILSNQGTMYLELIDTELEDDPISPGHYQLPGGVEVIWVSEHLTSNGGQAVQYVARSTRLDGKIKGSPQEDLRKAIWFIEREIARLEEDEE